jgi:uncharacterized membrane protein YfhO
VGLRQGVLFLQDGIDIGLPTIARENANCFSVEKIRTANYERFESSCSVDGVIVLNEFYEPSWIAHLDGDRVNILKVNANQLGVFLPRGAHIIEFTYAPYIFKYSLIFMVVGIVLTCLYFLYIGRANKDRGRRV